MKKADLIVAASETCADIWYLSGFKAPDDFVYYSVDGQKHIVLSPLEYDRAKTEVPDGVAVHDFREFTGKNSSKLFDLLHAVGRREKITSWRVPAYFPVAAADFLREQGYDLLVATGTFAPSRSVKSRTEVAAVEKANQTAQKAMRAAFKALSETTKDEQNRLFLGSELFTSEALRRIIDMECAGGGASASGTIAAGGTDSSQPHNCGSGVLYANTPIVIDIFPRDCTSGYWGDLTRTVVRGSAPDIVRKAFNAVKQARDNAINRIKPGVTGAELHTEVERFLAGSGFPTGKDAKGRAIGFFHGLGHGVGLEIHEMPRLSPNVHAPLVPGNVVTVEPGVYDAEWGGVRLEDLVAVTESGCRNLTTIETELEINF